mmetsp:Transcript_31908/g.54537  ORF Transcript_31908/g.54537 Transcript_31908/m.54537 type:complete len:212 (-) Transcript_31908:1174-1809(-)
MTPTTWQTVALRCACKSCSMNCLATGRLHVRRCAQHQVRRAAQVLMTDGASASIRVTSGNANSTLNVSPTCMKCVPPTVSVSQLTGPVDMARRAYISTAACGRQRDLCTSRWLSIACRSVVWNDRRSAFSGAMTYSPGFFTTRSSPSCWSCVSSASNAQIRLAVLSDSTTYCPQQAAAIPMVMNGTASRNMGTPMTVSDQWAGELRASEVR